VAAPWHPNASPVIAGIVNCTREYQVNGVQFATSRKKKRVAAIPPNHRRIVIIRDLRDTLISAYFSIKISHGIANESINMSKARDWLRARDQEVGLLAMLEHWLPVCAAIRETWLHAGEPLLR
jgi:hypothetical protein